ncbi:phosphomannomutase [Tieghemostelium lacteum]|uniref:Phosphomannomutase n=1 Tax=Tieghemostelium lacteum TaxID=361077 RepID=A0A151Z638_TIELA|nr:phosphomannomutase [Tieghemostelium lacteum]|eukprot:KYQ89419.1 phosphomannomutase [Tieghemostelium lacteum]
MSNSLIRSISGVRGVTGESLTPNMVSNHVVGFTRLLESKYGQTQKTLVLGRDSRVSGPWVEMIAIGSLVAIGYKVIHIDIASTPTVQFMVQTRKASGGIVITSSHNPIEWNGLKFIGPDGLFIDPENCTALFELADQQSQNDNARLFSTYNKLGSVEKVSNANDLHIDAIFKLDFIKVEEIKKHQYKVCLDSVNGAGGPIMESLLKRLGCQVFGMNLEPTGIFAHTPEPVPQNLGDLCQFVKKQQANFGIAVDPDVDRCVVIDENGVPLGEEYTLAMAVELLLGDCKRKGTVCKNLSSSRAIDDIAQKYGCTVISTPVGEIQVAKKMQLHNAVIGGEGNGGVMLPDIHIGRDAPVAAALILQLLSNRGGGSISKLKQTLPQYEIVKLKAAIEGLDPDSILAEIKSEYIQKPDLYKLNEDDGLKIDAKDYWVHLRKSNTEHIIRVIAESKTQEEATKVANEFIKIIESKRK